MGWLLVKAAISAAIIVAVSEVAERYPRLGAVLLTLPVVSILAFVMAWTKSHDLPVLSRLGRETLVLVPLGLPFFVPLAFAERLGLGYWWAMALGLLLASLTIGTWFKDCPDHEPGYDARDLVPRPRSPSQDVWHGCIECIA